MALIQLAEVRGGGPDALDIGEADPAAAGAGQNRRRRGGHRVQRWLGERCCGETRADEEAASSHVVSCELDDHRRGAVWRVGDHEPVAERGPTAIAAQADVLDRDLVAKLRRQRGGDQFGGWRVGHPAAQPVRDRTLVMSQPDTVGDPTELVHLLGEARVGVAGLRDQRFEPRVPGHDPTLAPPARAAQHTGESATPRNRYPPHRSHPDPFSPRRGRSGVLCEAVVRRHRL